MTTQRPVIFEPPLGVDPPKGYWEFTLNCEGDPDPGTIRIFVPGELLERFPSMIGNDVQIDPAGYARALAEYRAEKDLS